MREEGIREFVMRENVMREEKCQDWDDPGSRITGHVFGTVPW
jgi:hypothetical protein